MRCACGRDLVATRNGACCENGHGKILSRLVVERCEHLPQATAFPGRLWRIDGKHTWYRRVRSRVGAIPARLESSPRYPGAARYAWFRETW